VSYQSCELHWAGPDNPTLDLGEPVGVDRYLLDHLGGYTQFQALQQFTKLLTVNQIDRRCTIPGSIFCGHGATPAALLGRCPNALPQAGAVPPTSPETGMDIPQRATPPHGKEMPVPPGYMPGRSHTVIPWSLWPPDYQESYGQALARDAKARRPKKRRGVPRKKK
jgi:hypothetical protein